jgi:hypothetical protein
MLKVNVDESLGEALLTLRRAQTGTQDEMRNEADAAITASWVPALAARASGAQQTKLLVSGASADVSDLGFDLTAGAGPTLSGGLDNSKWWAVEFGAVPKQVAAKKRKATHRVKGSGREVRSAAIIWIGRNLPVRNNDGHVIFPTIGEQSQVFVGAWVSGLMGQFEGSPFDVDYDELGQVAGSWR